MSWFDVQVLRLLHSARAQGYCVVQDIVTRDVCLLTATDCVVRFADVAMVRSWLREHIGCGLFARRCSLHKGAGLVITTH